MLERYSYSTNEEIFHGEFKTREEALDEGRNEHPGETISTGRIVVPDLGKYAKQAAVSVFEGIGEKLYELAGEASEGQPNVSQKMEEELADTIHRILLRPGVVQCWGVEAIQCHDDLP